MEQFLTMIITGPWFLASFKPLGNHQPTYSLTLCKLPPPPYLPSSLPSQTTCWFFYPFSALVLSVLSASLVFLFTLSLPCRNILKSLL